VRGLISANAADLSKPVSKFFSVAELSAAEDALAGKNGISIGTSRAAAECLSRRCNVSAALISHHIMQHSTVESAAC
jgi:hypothetical protein